MAAVDMVVDRSIYLPAAWTYSASTASTVLAAVVGVRQLRPVAVASLVAGYVRRDFRRLVAAVADAPDVFGGVFEPNGEQPTLVVRSRRE